VARKIKNNMKKFNFIFGDRKMTDDNSISGVRTNRYALISIFIVLSSFLIQRILDNFFPNEPAVGSILFISLWVIAFIISVDGFIKKLIKNKAIDLYLLLLIVLILVSLVLLSIAG
jgi:hypothetical protein